MAWSDNINLVESPKWFPITLMDHENEWLERNHGGINRSGSQFYKQESEDQSTWWPSMRREGTNSGVWIREWHLWGNPSGNIRNLEGEKRGNGISRKMQRSERSDWQSANRSFGNLDCPTPSGNDADITVTHCFFLDFYVSFLEEWCETLVMVLGKTEIKVQSMFVLVNKTHARKKIKKFLLIKLL